MIYNVDWLLTYSISSLVYLVTSQPPAYWFLLALLSLSWFYLAYPRYGSAWLFQALFRLADSCLGWRPMSRHSATNVMSLDEMQVVAPYHKDPFRCLTLFVFCWCHFYSIIKVLRYNSYNFKDLVTNLDYMDLKRRAQYNDVHVGNKIH